MTKKILQWQSLGHLLREQAEKIGARTLLCFEGESMSFAQVEEGTNRLANVLRQHHVQKGNKVAVMLPNGIEFPLAWLAIAKMGAVMVPVNVQYREQELQDVLQTGHAKSLRAGFGCRHAI